MVEVWLPYGRTEVAVNIPDENFIGEIAPKPLPAVSDLGLTVGNALSDSLGAPKLGDIARGKTRAAVAIDQGPDLTFTTQVLSTVLNELNLAGVSLRESKVILARGLLSSPNDTIPVTGGLDPSQIIIHDPESENLAAVGETKLGTRVAINQAFASSDLKILVGYSIPSGLYGFSGVLNVVLPGICGSHGSSRSWSSFDDPQVKLGAVEGNPIRADMLEAARLVGVDFAINGVPDREGRMAYCFAGDMERVDKESLEKCREVFQTHVEKHPSIIITSAGGHPFDRSLQTASMCIAGASTTVRRDGTVIAACECSEGAGSREFVEWGSTLTHTDNPSRELKRKFRLEGHQALQVVEAAERGRVVLVSVLPDYYSSGTFRLKTSRTVNDALKSSLTALGKGSKVATIPYGTLTAPFTESRSE